MVLWLLAIWNVGLSLLVLLSFWTLARHRKYFKNIEPWVRSVREHMSEIARLLLEAGARVRINELRAKWSKEAPLGDPELQEKCMEFLNLLEKEVDAKRNLAS